MDIAILQRLFKVYNDSFIPTHFMPMIINKLGNSSVATLPTLLDLILNDKVENQELLMGSNIVFASVGAGMNINAFTYRFPVA
jgi:3-oxoacyl-[acyl-carrier-protein] synthase III